MSTTPPETTADLAARLERFVKEQAARYGDVISYVPVAGAAAAQITKEVAPTAAKEAKPTKKTAAKAAEAPSEVLASVTAGGLDVLREKLAPHAAEPWMAATSLEVMEQSIQGCQRCALGATRNKLVFGSGNPKAKVLVIGEAPGADEDEQGFPFVGRAGQLLTKMLEAVQFDRTKDVYIANILKSRPPNNRDPKPEEVEQCEVYLWKQILLLEPKLILCLGRVAGGARGQDVGRADGGRCDRR